MIWRTAVMPSISGMTMSMVTRSGFSDLYLSTASTPFCASPTTSNPFLLRIPLIIIRMTTASSTMRTRLLIPCSVKAEIGTNTPSAGNGVFISRFGLGQASASQFRRAAVDEVQDGVILGRRNAVEPQSVREFSGRRHLLDAHNLTKHRDRRRLGTQRHFDFQCLPDFTLAIHDEGAAASADVPNAAFHELADAFSTRGHAP